VAKKICRTSIENAYLAFDCESWSLPFSKGKFIGVWLSGISLCQTRVRVRPEPISGTPLLEQEFALREATVGKGLEV